MVTGLNFAGGMLRLWVFLSICWIALVAGVLGDRTFASVIAPPLVFGGMLAGLVWVAKGFKSKSKQDH
jgi:hypothetical protein